VLASIVENHDLIDRLSEGVRAAAVAEAEEAARLRTPP
jgi:hypothetical protein